ncbi:hypothetical protein C8Q74DRAFT_1215090 [Fomes fomentarius]|nr:hypothetical protein C8Q74DRAFT_1215090 [Fomes fomentarius]
MTTNTKLWSGTYPHAFSYKPEKATATLAVKDRALTLSPEVDSFPPNPATRSSAPLPPPSELWKFRYAKVADIRNIMEGVHVPNASTDALFDGFCVDEKDESSVIWIFQVTVSRFRGAAPSQSGFAMVEEIRAKVETARSGKRVEVKYVLVVPFEGKWAVRWDMADGFSKVPGEVYVQFLSIKARRLDYNSSEVIVGWLTASKAVIASGETEGGTNAGKNEGVPAAEAKDLEDGTGMRRPGLSTAVHGYRREPFKFQAVSPSEWTPCDSPAWQAFHQQWWGRDFYTEDEVVNVPSLTIWRNLCLLGESKGLLLVRKEYAAMYARLVDASRRNWMPPGVVVSGQPGIGKSYFAVYVLLRRLTDKEPTLFSTSSGTTFLFDVSGVRKRPSKTIDASDVFELLGLKDEDEARIWSLIDPGRKVEPIRNRLTNFGFFYAVFASPNETRYKDLLNKDGAPLWIMSPWEISELVRLIKISEVYQA